VQESDKRALAPDQKSSQEFVNQAYREYKEARAQALMVYYETMASSRTVYEGAKPKARSIYIESLSQARRIYEEVKRKWKV